VVVIIEMLMPFSYATYYQLLVYCLVKKLLKDLSLGNQVCNPICADFPTAPMKSKIQITVMA
jgi:hypothetical protein